MSECRHHYKYKFRVTGEAGTTYIWKCDKCGQRYAVKWKDYVSPRVKVWQEGVNLHDGRKINVGALELYRDSVPVAYNAAWDRNPIGQAFDLQRDEDGWVTLRIKFFEEIPLPLKMFEFSGYAIRLQQNHNTIFFGELAGISMLPIAANQGFPRRTS